MAKVNIKQLFIIAILFYLSSADLLDCEASLKEMISGKYNNTLKMIYYSGRDINDLGQFKSCNKLGNANYNLMITHANPINLMLGFCGPSICQPQDYKVLFNLLINAINTNTSYKIDISNTEFYQSESFNNRPISKGTMFFIIFTVILVCVLVIGTYLDFLSKKFPDTKLDLKHPILMSFSVTTNFNKLLALPEHTSSLSAFNGVKILCMLNISLSHSYVYQVHGPYTNPSKIIDWVQGFGHRIIYWSIYIVDIFFIISGFLLAYFVIAELKKKKGKFNWAMFYIHRLLRIAPVYFFIYFFYVFAFPHTGSGPAWPIHDYTNKSSCGEYWYSNLLFINNFLPTDEPSCMGWSWYIANDIQLYFISPIILFLHYKSKILGYSSCGLLLLANIITISIIASENNFNPGALHGTSQNENFTKLYEKPYSRMGAFVIGILMGFLYRGYIDKTSAPAKQEEEIELESLNAESPLLPQAKKMQTKDYEVLAVAWVHSQSLRFVAYVLGIALMLTIIFIPYNFETNGPDSWNKFSKVIFLAFEHILFSLGFVLAIFPIICGFGGSVKDFLASRHAQVVSRISFTYYIIHPIIIMYFSENAMQAILLEDSFILFRWFGIVLYTVIAAIICTLMIESPVLQLEKLLFRKAK